MIEPSLKPGALTTALLLMVTMSPLCSLANAQSLTGEGWKLAYEKNNILVHRRISTKSDLVETLTTATIDAAPKKVFSAITDYAHYPEFMPHIIASKVIEQEGNTQLIFQRVRISEFLRFMINDRYHVVTNQLIYPVTGEDHYRVEWELNIPATKKLSLEHATATRLNTGYWDIQRKNDGKGSRIEYYLHTDPGGSIPKTLVNAGTTQSIPDVINAVRSRSNSR